MPEMGMTGTGTASWTVAALLLAAIAGCGSSVQGAEDYNECVLRGIAVADNSAQAARVRQQCQTKYPGSVSQQRSRELPPAAMQKLELDAEIEFGEYLNGTAYNGNADILVTELTVAIEVGKPGAANSQLYTTQVNMGPLSRADVGILLELESQAIDWKIVSARGLAAR